MLFTVIYETEDKFRFFTVTNLKMLMSNRFFVGFLHKENSEEMIGLASAFMDVFLRNISIDSWASRYMKVLILLYKVNRMFMDQLSFSRISFLARTQTNVI